MLVDREPDADAQSRNGGTSIWPLYLAADQRRTMFLATPSNDRKPGGSRRFLERGRAFLRRKSANS